MILIDCRIGTPEATVPEKVRDQRASATFCTTSPILKGMRSLTASHCSRPRSVFFHCTKPKAASSTAGSRMNQ